MFVIVLNFLWIWVLKELLLEEINLILNDCVREGLDDVFYVYLINDEVNDFNLKMIKKICKDFIEIDV